MNNDDVEIEKKFLIKNPRNADDKTWADFARQISQTKRISNIYLLPDASGFERRIRRVKNLSGDNKGQLEYYYTRKGALGDGSAKRIEKEDRIEFDEYLRLLGQRDPYKNEILKTRYVIDLREGLSAEIDIYEKPVTSKEFDIKKHAIAEVEVTSEKQLDAVRGMLPACISVIRDVTDDVSFKNATLAERTGEPISLISSLIIAAQHTSDERTTHTGESKICMDER